MNDPNGKVAVDALVVPPPPQEPYLRIIPLGGCGEIGRNMTVIETNDDIVVVDCGLMFPDDEMFQGVDILINDFTYLRERMDKVRGLLVTHGHEDHIGGIPYFLREFNMPVFGTPLSLALVRAKMREQRKGEAAFVAVQGEGPRAATDGIEAGVRAHSCTASSARAPSRSRTVPGHRVPHGRFQVRPDADRRAPRRLRGDRAHRARGRALHALRTARTPSAPVTHPSGRTVGEAFTNIFSTCRKNIVVTSFASNVPRIQQVVDHAARFGRKIAFLGRSLTTVLNVATDLGYLQIPPGLTIRLDEIGEYPPSEIVVMTTGSQGEPMSALARLSVRDHPRMQIVAGDTIVISATPIPGNEKSVSRTINNLCRLGATVIHGTRGQAHVS